MSNILNQLRHSTAMSAKEVEAAEEVISHLQSPDVNDTYVPFVVGFIEFTLTFNCIFISLKRRKRLKRLLAQLKKRESKLSLVVQS